MKRKIRKLFGVQTINLGLESLVIQPKQVVGDPKRFKEFQKVISNEYISYLRRGKLAEATAMDKLYGKLQEMHDSIYAPTKNIPLDPIMKMQIETQKMISDNSLDS